VEVEDAEEDEAPVNSPVRLRKQAHIIHRPEGGKRMPHCLLVCLCRDIVQVPSWGTVVGIHS
jgi:hypothetical protein